MDGLNLNLPLISDIQKTIRIVNPNDKIYVYGNIPHQLRNINSTINSLKYELTNQKRLSYNYYKFTYMNKILSLQRTTLTKITSVKTLTSDLNSMISIIDLNSLIQSINNAINDMLNSINIPNIMTEISNINTSLDNISKYLTGKNAKGEHVYDWNINSFLDGLKNNLHGLRDSINTQLSKLKNINIGINMFSLFNLYGLLQKYIANNITGYYDVFNLHADDGSYLHIALYDNGYKVKDVSHSGSANAFYLIYELSDLFSNRLNRMMHEVKEKDYFNAFKQLMFALFALDAIFTVFRYFNGHSGSTFEKKFTIPWESSEKTYLYVKATKMYFIYPTIHIEYDVNSKIKTAINNISNQVYTMLSKFNSTKNISVNTEVQNISFSVSNEIDNIKSKLNSIQSQIANLYNMMNSIINKLQR